jgi:hypothetical protein
MLFITVGISYFLLSCTFSGMCFIMQADEMKKDADPNIVTAVSDMLCSLLNVELLVM